MGAGAGYTVNIKGISVDLEKIKLDKKDDAEVFFNVPIKECFCDKWEALGYYDSVDSDGIFYDGDLVMEYDKQDRAISGGVLHCSLDMNAVDEERFEDYQNPSEEEILSYIEHFFPNKVNLSYDYGGGWIHSNLNPSGFILGDKHHSCGDLSDYEFEIYTADVIAPDMASDVNWFFRHSYEIEEIFFDENYESNDDDPFSSQIPYDELEEAKKAFLSGEKYTSEKLFKDIKTLLNKTNSKSDAEQDAEKYTNLVLESLPDWQWSEVQECLTSDIKSELKKINLPFTEKNRAEMLKKIITEEVIGESKNENTLSEKNSSIRKKIFDTLNVDGMPRGLSTPNQVYAAKDIYNSVVNNGSTKTFMQDVADFFKKNGAYVTLDKDKINYTISFDQKNIEKNPSIADHDIVGR